jgi:hypothetical protein
MSKKSLIAVIIIVIVVAAGGWWYMASAKHQTNSAPEQKTAAVNNTPAPAAVNQQNTSANQANPASAQQNSVANNNQNKAPAQSVANSASTNSLVGNWVSSVKGKGMQGSGKIVMPKFTAQFSMNGDVKLVVKNVANNIASGIISYSNLCTVSTITMPGKPATVKSPECVSNESKAVELQISGNTLTFAGQTSTGANISFTGNYSGDNMSGKFTITGSSGDMNGTFSLDRAKN